MRPTNFIGLAICIFSLLFAYFFLEKQLGLTPCPLCILDRFVLAFMAVVFFIGFFINSIKGRYAISLVNIFFLIFGFIFAGRHVWVQNQEFDFATSVCLAEQEDIQNIMEIIKNSFQANADCGLISISFYGMTLPMLTFILFLGLLGLIGLQIFGIYQDTLEDENESQ